MTERERMLAGELYDPRDPELVAMNLRAAELCFELNQTRLRDRETRREILVELLGSGGETASIISPFHCDYGSQIHLGEKVFFNSGCIVLDVCEVRIGAHTLFGPAVQIYTATHPLDAVERRKRESGQPITIGNDVWVGGGAIICPGVTIGDRSVIGAGSVVTKDIPEGVLALGNPCRVVRELD